ncbi:hypothetical protein EVG20_g9166 [Dentipellis fragilis]|uniref:Uncharacterized protein n=1 Tax=Dentipellis fragilis TaxID=205917 RepID=A0A4Y9Y031_9AGAM|nr:hypothetical protein EVG20_g9166 [Dentipellis fragilis]
MGADTTRGSSGDIITDSQAIGGCYLWRGSRGPGKNSSDAMGDENVSILRGEESSRESARTYRMRTSNVKRLHPVPADGARWRIDSFATGMRPLEDVRGSRWTVEVVHAVAAVRASSTGEDISSAIQNVTFRANSASRRHKTTCFKLQADASTQSPTRVAAGRKSGHDAHEPLISIQNSRSHSHQLFNHSFCFYFVTVDYVQASDSATLSKKHRSPRAGTQDALRSACVHDGVCPSPPRKTHALVRASSPPCRVFAPVDSSWLSLWIVCPGFPLHVLHERSASRVVRAGPTASASCLRVVSG